MKNIKLITLVSVFGMLLSACDYLDTIPGDALTGDHFWQTADEVALEKYCNMFYPRLIVGHGSPNGWDCGDMFKNDYQSDNILPSGQNAVTYGQNTITTDDAKWNWEVIRSCNTFILNYQKTPASQAAKERYAGEVYFFKAWDYFNKVCRFGDVPWFDKGSDTDDPELYKGRDSRVLVMENVVKTIDKAIELLPVKSKVYRVSKDAALCLKARICLYEGTWRKYRNLDGADEYLRLAYDAAGELMDPKYGYKLYTEGDPDEAYFKLFIQNDYEGNSEVILSKQYVPSISMGNDVSKQMPNAPHGMSRDCYEEYLCAKTGLPISICGCHDYKDGFLKESANRDPRLSQTICIPDKDSKHHYFLYRQTGDELRGGAPNIMGILDSDDIRPFYGNSSSGYAIAKFYSEADFLNQTLHTGDIDSPVMRFAEVLLIRAEAGAELGVLDQAELDRTVNKLRERVGFAHNLTMNPKHDPNLEEKYPNVTSDLVREIRRERRVELFCEGYRWDDICRWHVGPEVFNDRERRGAYMDPTLYTADEIKRVKEKIGLDADGFILPYAVRGKLVSMFSEKNYLFNIPLNEIALNPNLAPNNYGWDE